jgi:hypothetical protein
MQNNFMNKKEKEFMAPLLTMVLVLKKFPDLGEDADRHQSLSTSL